MTEAALAPNATPQPPSVILQLLEKLAVPYQVRAERPGLPAAARLQAVLLDDAVGALLVLYPRSQLLDLGRLAELTGRQLTAVKPERLERMLGKHNLAALPGLPPLSPSVPRGRPGPVGSHRLLPGAIGSGLGAPGSRTGTHVHGDR